MPTKNVLITGGSRGIGHAMAIALARQGHRVAVTGRNQQKLKEVAKDLPGGIAILADDGVQVFCVSPGLVLTDMTRDLPFIKTIPQEDFHHPEDVSALACELITGKYANLTGHFIHVQDELPELLANTERLRKERLYQLSLHGLEGLIE